MSRSVYRGLLWLHPDIFRDRFAGEMLWIFDETVGAEGAAALLADGLWSLLRQWLVRRMTWKLAVAMLGALLQVGVVAALTADHAARRAPVRNVNVENPAPTAAGLATGSGISSNDRAVRTATIDPSAPAGDKGLPFAVLFGIVFVYAAQRRRLALRFSGRPLEAPHLAYRKAASRQAETASKTLSIIAD